MTKLTISLAQMNGLVGDIAGNTDRVLEWYRNATAAGADIVVTPELALCGYPPEDLLLRPSMQLRVEEALHALCKDVKVGYLIVGYPWREAGKTTNRAGVIHNGELIATYDKQCLPNYQVFDERRYFDGGVEATVFNANGIAIGLTICEDIWHDAPIQMAKAKGAELIININASPFSRNKLAQRHHLVQRQAKQNNVPIAYVNWVAGQDELVFDGASFAVNADGTIAAQAESFNEQLLTLTLEKSNETFWHALVQNESPSATAQVYQALVLGVKDYVNKNGFKGVVLGLSGGIDSALTLAVAVDALGKERVEAVMMPFRYTSQMSLDDAKQQADTMEVSYKVIGIEPIFNAFSDALADEFKGMARDTTEENLQARTRGVLLMAISNKKRYMVLTTGNKSEMSVGYATLYGDMAGGFDVLKDVPKTLVFELCRYRNSLSSVIPERVITRPPSAELAPDQVDEDSLPPYNVLDRILELYVERDYSAKSIIAEGFAEEDVYRVLRLVDINEYKRRQAAVGVRITERGFGKDRRYPITNGWKIGH